MGTSSLALTTNLPSGFVLPLFFYITLAFYTIFTGVLYYHWHTYTSDKKVASLTYIVYFALTLPLMILLGMSAFAS
jgi:hypothetical protein